MQIDRYRLQAFLGSTRSDSGTAAAVKSAAVLVPLLRIENGEWHLLFIRRAEASGDVHSGQVAFPGGRLEHGESPRQAALREAEEEIALQTADIDWLGSLQDVYSIGGYRVSPQLAFIPWPYRFVLQQREVSRVFTLPLPWLADPAHYRVETQQFNGRSRDVIYYQEYNGEQLWGLSAAIVQSLLQTLSAANAASQ